MSNDYRDDPGYRAARQAFAEAARMSYGMPSHKRGKYMRGPLEKYGRALVAALSAAERLRKAPGQEPMTEPARHQDSERSRRKVAHQIEVIISELDALFADFAKLRIRFKYIHSKAMKLQNRLREIV